MSRPTANLRMFVAVYPPHEHTRALLDQLPRCGARPVPPEQVHLTLHFIGDVPARDLDAVGETVWRCAAGLPPFALTPLRLATLPERARPRLIAAITDAPASLMELQRRLAHRLAKAARAKPADNFLPHLTLARFTPGERPPHDRSPRNADAGADEIAIASEAGDAADPASTATPMNHPLNLPPFLVDHVCLIRSTLSPAGAIHYETLRVPLPAPV